MTLKKKCINKTKMKIKFYRRRSRRRKRLLPIAPRHKHELLFSVDTGRRRRRRPQRTQRRTILPPIAHATLVEQQHQTYSESQVKA